LIKSILILCSVLYHSHEFPSDAAPIVGMGAAAQRADMYSWANVISALGNLLWVFAPVFINTELVAEMQKPQKANTQLFAAAGCVAILYIVVGVTTARVWGTSVQDPINLQLPYDWMGISVNCLLIYGAGLDYLISEIVCTNYVQEVFEPSFDKKDFSLKACCRWLVYSMPANICAIVLICFVPQLETLVGVITATCVTLGSLTLPALTSIHFGRLQHADEETGQGPTIASISQDGAAATLPSTVNAAARHKASMVPRFDVLSPGELRYWLIASLGVYAMLALIASSVYDIATTDYEGNFFCEVVG
jgi:hypothetical protein